MNKSIALFFLLLFTLASFTLSAQQNSIEEGRFEIGIGNIASIWLYGGSNYEKATEIIIGHTPPITVGYFVIDGLRIGLTTDLDFYKSESMTEYESTIDIEPNVKYYFPLSEDLIGNIKVLFGWVRSTYDGDPEKYTRTRFGFGGAVTYMFLPNIGAYVGLDYVILPDRKISGTTIDNTSFNVTDIGIGFTLYI